MICDGSTIAPKRRTTIVQEGMFKRERVWLKFVLALLFIKRDHVIANEAHFNTQELACETTGRLTMEDGGVSLFLI